MDINAERQRAIDALVDSFGKLHDLELNVTPGYTDYETHEQMAEDHLKSVKHSAVLRTYGVFCATPDADGTSVILSCNGNGPNAEALSVFFATAFAAAKFLKENNPPPLTCDGCADSAGDNPLVYCSALCARD